MKLKKKLDFPLSKDKKFPKVKLLQTTKNRFKVKNNRKPVKGHKLVCEKCEEPFKTWWEIREHWLLTGHKAQEQCRWCRKKTFTLQSHLCKHHWNMASMCSFCGQMFMFKEHLEKHLHFHDGTEYRCFLCGRRRKDKDLLRKHILSHYLYEKYGCNMCEKRFKRKKNLEKHLKAIHFICQYCGKSSKDKLEFKTHLSIHNDLKCLLCLKVFSQKNRLKYHYQLKHGHQDFYKCTICFQRFVTKGRLLNHLKLKHNGVAKFMCKMCNAPFLYWKNYKNHFEKVHANVKNEEIFKCVCCDFSTDLKLKLQYHMEKTSGGGFFCKKCQIQLECKGMFDKHMMKEHEGETSVWTCDYCSKSCVSDDTLRHHMSLVHPKVVMAKNPQGHPCLFPDCTRYYATKSSLARHIRRNHSDSSYHTSDCNTNTVVCQTPLTSARRHKQRNNKSIRNSKIITKADYFEEEHKGYHHLVEEPPEILEVDVYTCVACKLFWFSEQPMFKEHISTHEDEVWEKKCSVCEFQPQSPENAVRHYVEDHLKVQFVLS